MRFLILCFALLFVGCFEDIKDTQKLQNVESQIIKLQNNQETQNIQDSAILKEDSADSTESPLQKGLKKNLKSHLDSLGKDLQDKNLEALQLERNSGMQKHIEHFESLHGRKDIPKNDSKESLNQKIQKAYELQQERIERLRQKNDEISK